MSHSLPRRSSLPPARPCRHDAHTLRFRACRGLIGLTAYASIKYFSPALSRFGPHLFYWIFIPADMVCLVFQAVGGALATASAGTSQAGATLALVGLGLQVAVMVVFCGFFADYLVRYFRYGPPAKFGRRCKLFFVFMALAVVLILTRCTYRLVELRDGYRGSLIRDEYLFIALEGVCVFEPPFHTARAHGAYN